MHYGALAVLFVIALAIPFVFGTLSILGSMTVFLLLLSWSISWRQGRLGLDDQAKDRSSWIFWGMAGVIALIIPVIAGTPFFLATMVAFFIYLTWNTMWGLVLGTAGLQSFATVAVAGISAYAAAYLTIDITDSNAAAAGAECSGDRLFGVPVLGEQLDPVTVGFSLAVIAVVFVSRRMAVGQPKAR